MPKDNYNVSVPVNLPSCIIFNRLVIPSILYIPSISDSYILVHLLTCPIHNGTLQPLFQLLVKKNIVVFLHENMLNSVNFLLFLIFRYPQFLIIKTPQLKQSFIKSSRQDKAHHVCPDKGV